MAHSSAWLHLSIQFMLTMKRRGDKIHPCQSPTPKWNGFDCLPFTRTQTSGRRYCRMHNNEPLTPNSRKPFQSLSRGTQSYAVSRSTKHAKTFLTYYQDFSKICFRVKIWSVVLRPERKRTDHLPVLIPLFVGISFQGIWRILFLAT